MEGAVVWLGGDQGVGFSIGFCSSFGDLFWCWVLLSLVRSSRLLWDFAWSAGRAVIVRDVRSLFICHCVFWRICLLMCPILGSLVFFRYGCAADVSTVTDGGLLTLAGAGVGPCLEHLEITGESADFEFNSWCFSVVVFTSFPVPVRR